MQHRPGPTGQSTHVARKIATQKPTDRAAVPGLALPPLLDSERARPSFLHQVRWADQVNGRRYAGTTMPISGDQVVEVRKAIYETQVEFGRRFGRSRFSVIRWEYQGTRFKFKSRHWHAWQDAVAQAIKQINSEGVSDDEVRRLQQLQIF